MKNLPVNELIERLRFEQWLEETRLQDTSDGKMWRAWKAAKTWLPDDDRAFIKRVEKIIAMQSAISRNRTMLFFVVLISSFAIILFLYKFLF